MVIRGLSAGLANPPSRVEGARLVGELVQASTGDLAESSVIQGRAADPTTAERVLSEVLAELLSLDGVSVDSHFFEELGADSMVMARVCARVRKRGDLPPISMKDVYRYPTIRMLAAALQDGAPSVKSTAP